MKKARERSALTRAINSADRRYTVVYDGSCKVCTSLVAVLAEWDRDGVLEIVPSQAPGVQARFPWITPRMYADSIQVVRASDGRTWQGAGAIEAIVKAVPEGRLIGWIFAIPLVRPLAERLYYWFARRRYRFGCDAHCEYQPTQADGASENPRG